LQSRLKRAIGKQDRQRGYILLTLLLVMALFAIAATVAAPGIVFQVKRDREEELVHRGIQYRRAVRLYVTKTGRYPTTPQALLGNADARYIRKLYKDPVTGSDFRLLHMGDVQPGVGLGTPIQPNQNGAGDNNGNPSSQGVNGQATPNTNAPDQQNSTSPGNQQTDGSTAPVASAPGTSPSLASSVASAGSSTNTATGSQPGLLIFGVASKSKDRTIREFNRKNHYSDWWFYYDPRATAGYEVKGPTPPATAIQPPINPPGSQPSSNSFGVQSGPQQLGPMSAPQ
jgi:type II secretory pathway pseudopilin PulG